MLSRALHRVSVRPIQVLVVALLLAPLLAFSSPPGRASSGVAVAGGTVTSASGAAIAGQIVDLYAWPSNAVLQALKPGQLVPTTLLATATTSGTGQYMLRVPAAKLKAAAVEAGYANLEIYSPLAGVWFSSYQTDSLPGRPSAPVKVPASPAIGVKCPKDQFGRQTFFSGFSKVKQLHNAWAVVGQGYVAPEGNKTKGDFMQFDYNQTVTKSQTSTLGLGVSGKAIDVGYKKDGTNVSTAKAEQDYPNEDKSTWFRTLFNVAQYRGECHGSPGDNTVQQIKQKGYCPRKFEPISSLVYYTRKCFWMVASTGWFGPSGTVRHPTKVPSTPGKFCGFELKGGKGHTFNQEAVQWSSGFDIGASNDIRGVKVKVSFSSSAQTGYDTNAEMKFVFKHAGWLCGTDHDTNKASLLVMRGHRP